MARLSKRERQAKAAWVQARSDKVRENTAGRSQGSKLAGLEREYRLLSGAARFTSPAALKQHSLTRGCSAPHSGHGSQRIQHATISGLIRGGKAPKAKPQRFKVWAQPVPQDKLPAYVVQDQAVKGFALYDSRLQVTEALAQKRAADERKRVKEDTLTPVGFVSYRKRRADWRKS